MNSYRVSLLVFGFFLGVLILQETEARTKRSDGYYIQTVQHDASLSGDGTSASPLAAVAGSVTPAAHQASHLSDGSDPISAATNSVRGTILIANDAESAATKACMSNDSRLTNARTPTAHQSTHLSDGSDPISPATNTVRGTVLVANDEENTDQKVPKANDGRLLASTAQKTDLTDAGDTTLHYHATDRARANHTGTQARSTISDFAHADTHATAGDDPIPEANTITPGLAKFATDGEASALEAVQGNDARMTNARTPTAHQATHLSDGSDPISAATSTIRGTILFADNLEADPNKALKSDDDRLLDSGTQRVDLTDAGDTTLHYHATDRARANHTGTQARSTISDFAHATTHDLSGTDPLVEANTITPGIVRFATDGEASASEAVQGNDARMSNSRTPTAHATTHKGGGSDVIANASQALAGLMSSTDKLKSDALLTYTAYGNGSTIGLLVHVAAVTSTTSDVTLTLPSAITKQAGGQVIVKDESGAAATKPIVIITSGGQTIDGASASSINQNYGSLSLYSNGANWFIY